MMIKLLLAILIIGIVASDSDYRGRIEDHRKDNSIEQINNARRMWAKKNDMKRGTMKEMKWSQRLEDYAIEVDKNCKHGTTVGTSNVTFVFYLDELDGSSTLNEETFGSMVEEFLYDPGQTEMAFVLTQKCNYHMILVVGPHGRAPTDGLAPPPPPPPPPVPPPPPPKSTTPKPTSRPAFSASVTKKEASEVTTASGSHENAPESSEDSEVIIEGLQNSATSPVVFLALVLVLFAV